MKKARKVLRRSYDAEFKKMIVELYESGKKAASIFSNKDNKYSGS